MGRFFLALLLAGGGLGCSNSIPIYDECRDVRQCEGFADGCYVIQGALGSQSNMCSRRCTSDLDCPRGFSGQRGACYEAVGNLWPICYERCISDFDCPDNLICEGVVESIVPGLALDRADAICLPP